MNSKVASGHDDTAHCDKIAYRIQGTKVICQNHVKFQQPSPASQI